MQREGEQSLHFLFGREAHLDKAKRSEIAAIFDRFPAYRLTLATTTVRFFIQKLPGTTIGDLLRATVNDKLIDSLTPEIKIQVDRAIATVLQDPLGASEKLYSPGFARFSGIGLTKRTEIAAQLLDSPLELLGLGENLLHSLRRENSELTIADLLLATSMDPWVFGLNKNQYNVVEAKVLELLTNSSSMSNLRSQFSFGQIGTVIETEHETSDANLSDGQHLKGHTREEHWREATCELSQDVPTGPDLVPIERLNLSVRAHNALLRYKPDMTLGDLMRMGSGKIAEIRGIGKQCIEEIESKLVQLSLELDDFYKKDSPTSTPTSAPTGPSLAELLVPDLVESNKLHVLAQRPISVLPLNVRVRNALLRADIGNLHQLLGMTADEVLSVKNLGPKGYDDLFAKLKEYLSELVLKEELEALVDDQQGPLSHSLLEQAQRLPLDQISIARLALPLRESAQLHKGFVHTLQDLLGLVLLGKSDKRVGEVYVAYLEWLAAADEATVKAEVAADSLNPFQNAYLHKWPLGDQIEQWLGVLPERSGNVIRWRYGLWGNPLTLEEISSEHLHITRERVRQIQKRAEVTLQAPQNLQAIHNVILFLRQVFSRQHGLLNGKELTTLLEKDENIRLGGINPLGLFQLISAIDKHFHHTNDLSICAPQVISIELVNTLHEEVSRFIDERRFSPPTLDEVFQHLKSASIGGRQEHEQSDEFIRACVRIHPELEVQEDQTCVLSKWANSRIDGIVAALRKLGKPVHYTKIAEEANVLLPANLRTSAHNVHAQIQRLSDVFVRVGHGIYGLKEWGLIDDGNLANASYRVLAEAGTPLHVDIITDEVLKTWQVNDMSVYMAIENDDRFIRIGRGVYCLREQLRDGMENASPVDFGSLFSDQLSQWQTEFDDFEADLENDAYDEVDKLQNIGLDFFS